MHSTLEEEKWMILQREDAARTCDWIENSAGEWISRLNKK